MSHLILNAVTCSESETVAFGQRLGSGLRSPAVVGLTGSLGTGKTRLAIGIARGAGFCGRVRSPTFSLMHLYRGTIPIRHFDLYRLDSIDPGLAGEWEEEMEAPGISMIEWADRIPELLPENAIWIDLHEEGNANRRSLSLRAVMPNRTIGNWRFA